MIQNWLQLIGLISAAVVGMPRLLLGFTFYTDTTSYNAILGIMAASALSYISSVIMLEALNGERMVTPLLYQRYLGSSGKVIIASLLTAGALVWLAIHTTFLIDFIQDTFNLSAPYWPYIIFSIALSIGLLLGIKMPRLLSHSGNLNVFLLLILLAAMLYSAYQQSTASTLDLIKKPMTFLDVFSIMYGLSLFTVFNVPSVFRSSASLKDSKRALLVLNAIIIPLLALIGWMAAHLLQEPTLQDCCNHHGWLIAFSSSAFFITAGICALGGTAFTASASLSSLAYFHDHLTQLFAIVLSVVLLYATGIAHNILPAIGLAGVGMVSLGGVVIMNQLRKKIGRETLTTRTNLVGVTIGVIVGVFSFMGYALTANASVDALLATCITLAIASFVVKDQPTNGLQLTQ